MEHSQIRGIIPAIVTPLKDDELNEPALRRTVDYLVGAGVHGIFATGSQGEFWALSAAEKRRVWEVTLEQAAGRVPVYAGTGASTTREAIQLTRMAEQVGVQAVSVLTPYFIRPNQNELTEHYRAVAASTRLPIILYTNPDRTSTNFQVGTLRWLAKVDNIVGIKDSSGDLTLLGEYIRLCPAGFAVLVGRDSLIYGALCYGAQGGIAATANVCPRLVVRIYDCFQAGDHAGAAEAQRRLAPLRAAFSFGSYPAVIKEAMDMMGFEAGPARRWKRYHLNKDRSFTMC